MKMSVWIQGRAKDRNKERQPTLLYLSFFIYFFTLVQTILLSKCPLKRYLGKIVASTPTSRKDATPRCPSSSRFIQEHLALQCRNRNPLNNPGALNTLLTPPNHPSHVTAVHRFTASDDTSGKLTRHGICAVQVAGMWLSLR